MEGDNRLLGGGGHDGALSKDLLKALQYCVKVPIF